MPCREEVQLFSVQSDGGEICALPSTNSEQGRAAQTVDAKFYKGGSHEALSPRVGDQIIEAHE